MDTKTSIIMFIVIFYGVTFGLLALVPVSFETDTITEYKYRVQDSYLKSECDFYIIDIYQYYDCDGVALNAEFITSENATHYIVDYEVEEKGFLRWVLEQSEAGVQFLELFDNANTRITGMHPVFQIILWTPLSFLIIWLLILLAVWVIPFIGGGA